MKKFIVIFVLLLTFFGVSTSANAFSWWWYAKDCTLVSVISGDTKVEMMYTYTGLTGTETKEVDPSVANLNEILAIALTAISLDKDVNFKIDSGKIVGIQFSD